MKTNDIIMIGAAGFAAYLMLRSRSQAAPGTFVTRTVTQPGSGTVGNFAPPVSIRDYIAPTVPDYAADFYKWEANYLNGTAYDANTASVNDAAMTGGMSVDPNSIAAQVAAW